MCFENLSTRSYPGEQLDVRHDEHRIGMLTPRFPRRRNRLELGTIGQSPTEHLLGEARFERPHRPRVAPPLREFRRRICPRRGGDELVGEPGRIRPAAHPPPRIGKCTVRTRDRKIQLAPALEFGHDRPPTHLFVIGIARGNNASRPSHPGHFAQGCGLIGEVLEHLVRMRHIEGVVGVGKVKHIAKFKSGAGVTTAGSLRATGSEPSLDRLNADDLPRFAHECGEVERDCARSAPHVEQPHPRFEVRNEIAARVRGRARGVGCEH